MEEKIVREIKKIVDDGGIVTIDCKRYEYVPAPMRDLENCINFVKIDESIKMNELIKKLQNDLELTVVQTDPIDIIDSIGIYIIGKRGTSIVV